MANPDQPEQLAAELLKAFHIQFAENQRTREQSFLKILGFLGAVVLGYAYVYKNFSSEVDSFSLIAITSTILLFFGATIVTVIAYSFRRDQYVCYRIRDLAKISGKDKPFPEDYNPSSLFNNDSYGHALNRLLWLPDLFRFYFLVFPIFQILILVSYVLKRNLHFCFSNPNGYDTLTIIIATASFSLSIYMAIAFGSKLKHKMKKWEEERTSSNERPDA